MEMQEKIGALYDAIVSLENREQCQELFDDLCTPRKLRRWLNGSSLPSCCWKATPTIRSSPSRHLLRHSEPGVPVRAVRKGIFPSVKA